MVFQQWSLGTGRGWYPGSPGVGYHPDGWRGCRRYRYRHPFASRTLDSSGLSGYDMIRDTFISNDDDGAIPTRPTPVTT